VYQEVEHVKRRAHADEQEVELEGSPVHLAHGVEANDARDHEWVGASQRNGEADEQLQQHKLGHQPRRASELVRHFH